MADQENRKPNENPRNGTGEESRTRRPLEIRRYFAVGLTAVIVIFVALAIFFFFYRFNGFSSGVGKVITSLYGVIFGLILAFLLNPVMKFFERLLRKCMFRKAVKRSRRQNRTIRALAVTIAMLCFLAVVVILLVLIVPQLFDSIADLTTTLDDKLSDLAGWLGNLFNNTVLAEQIENLVNQVFTYIENLLMTQVFGSGNNVIETIAQGAYSALRLLIDIVVAIIVAIYVLMTKERFMGQAKKLIYAIFKPRAGNVVIDFFRRGNEVFGGFFVGKIIDSLIVGFICLAFMWIAHFPYIALISVIIGVTNIIPVFGPFIGAIPSVILILMVDPIYALYFIIFIIVLQQVDGNIIGPRILGNTTELSPFWIIFSILLFGGAFGIVGMIFGVPIFAMIYYVIKRIAEFVLKRNDLPEESMDYAYVQHIDPESHDIERRDANDDRRLFSALKTRRQRQKEEEAASQTEEDSEEKQ